MTGFDRLNTNYYLLLMSGMPDKWDAGSALMPTDRYLERTADTVKPRFTPLDERVRDELMSMPALFAYEVMRNTPLQMRVGRITRIQQRSDKYYLMFEFDPRVPPLDLQLLSDWKDDLDVDFSANEQWRTHWSVKEVDLYDVLHRRGVQIRTLGGNLPAPATAEAAGRAERFQTGAGTLQAPCPERVFIVHGRADGVKLDVARFLEQIGIEPVILHERPNGGRTLIAKFQEESADVKFAVVLMTPDDVGGLNDGLLINTTRPRARQNVIFELGFFIGKLGPGRVCALVQGEVEKPSDFDAVVYVKYDGSGAWKQELLRELAHAGISNNAAALFAGKRR